MATSEIHEFQQHRPLLEGIAYRMCGILADAQDIVQETYLKWHTSDRTSIENPRSWLTTVCVRLAIDLQRKTRTRREQYIGVWLPEPLVESSNFDPAHAAQIDDSASFALMVALEKLNPTERAILILHDVFSYTFPEIAAILDRSEPSCRKTASRARAAVQQDHTPKQSSNEAHQQLSAAFFHALDTGDLTALKSLLLQSVELHSDGGGKVKTAPGILQGPDSVSAFFLGIWQAQAPDRDRIQITDHWFNGSPGKLINKDGSLIGALSFAVRENKIHRIFALRNPDKLHPFATAPSRSQTA